MSKYKAVGSFVNISEGDRLFGGCDSCGGKCCDGVNGFCAAPLVLEDFAQVYERFPILFSLEDSIKALVVLNNGLGYCPYYRHSRCSIYEHRTPACKLYPISPYFDEILVDTACPAVFSADARESLPLSDRSARDFRESSMIKICTKGQLEPHFFTKRLEGFLQKRLEMEQFCARLNKEAFECVGIVRGMRLYRYMKQSDDPYLRLHQESLKVLSLWELSPAF